MNKGQKTHRSMNIDIGEVISKYWYLFFKRVFGIDSPHCYLFGHKYVMVTFWSDNPVFLCKYCGHRVVAGYIKEKSATEVDLWNGEVELLFANNETELLTRDPKGSVISNQNIYRKITFPSPLIGIRFVKLKKYVPLLELTIFLEMGARFNAKFYTKNSYYEGERLVLDSDLRMIFDPILPKNGIWITVTDKITNQYFFLSIDPCASDLSERKTHFGFRPEQKT
jgi:hypothetical protein